MKSHLVLILSLVAITYASAQNSFAPGYIITSESDTIQGYVLERTDAELARRISLKPQEKGISKTYTAAQLSGFGFDKGRVFRQMTTFPSAEDTSYVFAKNLVRGKIDLYVLRYPHQVKPDIFLINNSTSARVQLFRPEKRRPFSKNNKTSTQENYTTREKLLLIKGDSGTVGPGFEKKYSEKRIKKDILSYNRRYAVEYPIEEYKEPIDFKYDFLGGLPFQFSEELHFRVGLYRNKSRLERTTNFSVLQGLVYQHWSKDKDEGITIPEGNLNYRWQFLNLIPIGIRFHGNSKVIQPYGYAGVGLGVIMMNDRVIENEGQWGEDTRFSVLPTLNFGVGTKINIGNTSFLTELTPTITGLFWNAGFSF